MKVLIAPMIQRPKSGSAYYLTQNLASLLSQHGHAVAVCAEKANAFHHASVYPSTRVKAPFRFSKDNGRTYEEWMEEIGALDKDYLIAEMKNLLYAIDHFRPDLIITIDSLAAVSAGRMKSVPVYAVVHSSLYKNIPIPVDTLKGYNAFLYEYKLEQVLRLKEVYAQCAKRIGFGPLEIQPFSIDYGVDRIGIASAYPVYKPVTNRVCVFLADVKKNTSSLRKIISEAFLGAPYDVYVWYPGCKAQKLQNIQFMLSPRADMIPGSICVIHDGSSYCMNQCMAQAIPQVMITSRSCIRSYNGQALERNKIGIALNEDELSVGKLYEAYREVLSDDDYDTACRLIKEKITMDGDLSKIITMIEQH